jgi:VWFA-related protein
MKRHLTIVALAWIAVVSGAGGQQKPTPPEQQQPPPPVFRTEANFVRVDAFPTKDGTPVHGLTAEEFEVFEDGVPQTISSFEHVVIDTGTPPASRIEPNSVREGERMAGNPRNRVFIVFLDVPHVDVAGSHAIKEPLIRLMGRMMGPDDLVAVMTPSMSAASITFGRRTEVIERGLRENWPWGVRHSIIPMDTHELDYERCYPPLTGERSPSALARTMIDRRRERMVLESLHDLVTYLGGVREERKAIITVTEGWRLYRPDESLMKLRKDPVTGTQDPIPGTDPIGVGPDGRLRRNPQSADRGAANNYGCDTDRLALASMDNDRYFRDLLDTANKANSTFYPIDPRGLPVFDDPIGPARPMDPATSQRVMSNKLEVLKTLAENTDGLAILNNNDLDKGMKRISDDLTSYYLLGYYSTNPKLDGRFRALRVRVKRPGVSVRARRGYRAATAAEISSARAAASVPVSAATSAVADAVSELARIRPDMPFVIRAVAATSPGTAGISAVWIAGELQGREAPATGGTATLDISSAGAAVATSQAELKPGERTFLIKVPLEKPLTQADVRARFALLEPPGTPPLSYTARVVLPAGLGEPLMFRRGPSSGNRQLPVAGFQFSRTDRMRLEIALGVDEKPGQGRVLDKTGQALPLPVAMSERADTDSGHRWLVAEVVLAPLGAGDYAIEVMAATPAGEKKRLTAFRVTR